MKRRDFLIVVTMVSAISTPRLGAGGVADNRASRQRYAKRRLDTGFLRRMGTSYLTGFEPPASGPGPVRNRSRRRDGVANFQQLVGDYTNPILQPWAAEVVKKHGEISLAGQGYPTPSNQCWPAACPYVFWDFLLQIFQRPDQS